MTKYSSAYKFQEDQKEIKMLQEASCDSRSTRGLKIENGVLIGTKKWFQTIEEGELVKETTTGVISRVYMTGHNDFPEFEVESKGGRSTWMRKGSDHLYQVGKNVEIDFVHQKFKRPLGVFGQYTKQVLEIRVEK